MKKLSFIVLVLFCLVKGWGQPPTRFYMTFGGEGDDIGYSGKVTLDNQYIVAGSTSSYGNDNTDLYLVKLSTMGVGLWTRQIGGIGNDVGKSVIQLPDSGYVIAGHTSSYGAGGYDAYIVKTDKSGNLVWQRTFGGTDWDFANDLVLGADGNIFVVGYTESFGSGKRDGFILKYDVFGNLLSQKLIGGVENEELRSIISTTDNMLATVGYTESNDDIYGDAYLLKMNLNLDTIYTRRNGGPGRDFANDLLQRPNGEIVICGAKTYSTDPFTHSLMYGYLESSDTIWENHYNSSAFDEEMYSVAQSYQILSNSAYLRNVPVPNAKVQGNIIVAKPQGWPYLVNSFGGVQEEFFSSLEGTKDGGYISVGWTSSFGARSKDVIFIKLDSTIINYESVVSVTDIPKIYTPKVFYLSASKIAIQFSEVKYPEKIFLTNLEGKVLEEFEVNQERVDFDLSKYDRSLYLLRFKYSNGHYSQLKIVNY